jgi:hypothetical protein
VSTKIGIEQACLKENERRFQQALDTSFTMSPVLEAFVIWVLAKKLNEL